MLILDAERLGELRLLGWQLDDHSGVLLGDVSDSLRSWGESASVIARLRELICIAHFDARGEAIGELVPGVNVCVAAWGECVLAALPTGVDTVAESLAAIGELSQDNARAVSAELIAYCVHPSESVSTVMRSAAWAISSERLFRDSREAIVGYANELATAHETIDFLYHQGKLMYNIDSPDSFVDDLCDGLCRSLNLSWAAVFRVSDEVIDSPDASCLRARGEPTMSNDRLLTTAQELMRIEAIHNRTRILPAGSWGPFSGDRELLARVVQVGGKMGAVVMGGTAHPKTRITSHEVQLVDASSGMLGAFLDIARLWNAEQDHMTRTLEALVRAIDAKDPYTSGHSTRVAWLSREIARAHGMDEHDAERAWVAGLVHDIGKIGIAEAVLCKSGRLTDEEFQEIKKHPEIGYRILERLPHFDDVRPAVLSHHERMDGRGYPHGLSGEEIPLLARIVGLADTFDAMSSNRAYRPAMNREVIRREIRTIAGAQCDTQLVDAFERVDLTEYDELLSRHAKQRVVGKIKSAA